MGRVLGVLLAIVLVVAGAAVGGAYAFDDRIRSEVEGQVAANLKTTVPFTVLPTVEIEGHPIALHLLTRRFPSVRARGAQVPTQLDAERTLNLLNVDMTLTDVVHADTTVDAAHVAGTARLAWAEVSQLAGVQVTDAGGGRLAASGSAEVLGFTVHATLTGVPALDTAAQTLTIAEPEVDLAGVRLPDQATQALVDTFLQPFAVPLPYALALDGVTPGPDGLGVSVTGRDVSFPR